MQVGQLWVNLGLDRSAYDRGLAAAEKDAKGFGSTLTGILKQGVSFALGMGLFEGLRAGLRGAAQAGIGFNAQLEQAQIAFETMLGSGEKARNFLDQLAAFAAKTPFEFPELIDATKRMLAFGFASDDVVPTLTAVGNAASGLGMSGEGINRIVLAMGQMKAKAKVSGEEMRQLTEAGIPAWDMLAQAMGKSTSEVMKLSERGLIPADQAMRIFVEGMNKRFPDMMKKQSTTWLGMLSTLSDEVRYVFADLMEGGFARLKTGLASILPMLGQFRTILTTAGLGAALKSLIPSGMREEVLGFVNQLQPAFENLKATWAGLGPIVNDLWKAFKTGLAAVAPLTPPILNFVTGLTRWIVEHWPTLKPLIIGVVSGFLAFRGLTTVTTLLGQAKGALEGARYSLTLFQMGLRDAPDLLAKFKLGVNMLLGVNPVFLAIAAGVAVVAAGAYLVYKNWDQIAGWFKDKWEQVHDFTVEAWEKIRTFFAANWPAILALLTGPVGPAVLLVVRHWDEIKQGAQVALDNVAAFFKELPGRLLGAISGLPGKLYQTALDWGRELIAGWRKGTEEGSPNAIERALARTTDTADRESLQMEKLLIRRAGSIGAAAKLVAQHFDEVKNAVAQNIKAAVDTVQFNLARLDKLWELWQAGFTGSADSVQYLTQELDYYNQKLALVHEEMRLLEQRYEESQRLKGEDAEETRKLALEILDLRVQEEGLAKAIAETNQARAEKVGQSSRVGKIITATQTVGNLGDYVQRGIELFKERVPGVSSEEAKQRILGGWGLQPDEVAGLASGGIVTRPTLAMIGEAGPEAVVPLESYPPARPVEISLHIGTLVADDHGLKMLERKLREIRIKEDVRLGVALS